MQAAVRQQEADIGPHAVGLVEQLAGGGRLLGKRGGQGHGPHLGHQALAHALIAVSGKGVGHLVAQNHGQPGIVTGEFKDAGVNGGFAAGHDPGVHLLIIIDQVEFPLELGDFRPSALFAQECLGRLRNPPAHPAHGLHGGGIGGQFGFLNHLAVFLEAHGVEIGIGHHLQTLPIGQGDGGAGIQNQQGGDDAHPAKNHVPFYACVRGHGGLPSLAQRASVSFNWFKHGHGHRQGPGSWCPVGPVESWLENQTASEYECFLNKY